MALSLRPGFAVDLAVPSHEVIERLCAQLAAGPMLLRRTRVPGGGREAAARNHDHLVLTVPTAQQRMWSPWLTIEVSPAGDRTQLLSRFSPSPSVWTGFAFGYLSLGLVLLLSLVFAGALALTGGQPWALWITAGAALALAGLWWASQLGQRLARTQMDALRDELDRALAGCGVNIP